MTVGYRALFRLPPGTSAVTVASKQMRVWLQSKKHPGTADAADWDTPGTHQVGPDATLLVTDTGAGTSGHRLVVHRFVERNSRGTWGVTVAAFTTPDTPNHQHRQTVIVETGLKDSDEDEAIWKVAPPRVAGLILASTTVHDSRVPLTATPRPADASMADEILDQILDPDRRAAVIISDRPARSFITASDWPDVVAGLTKNTMGNAAVFIPDDGCMTRLGKLLPSPYGIPYGATRTYLPGVNLRNPSDARRHRVLSWERLQYSVHGTRVQGGLPHTFAESVRRKNVEQELPPDVRQNLQALAHLERG